MSNSLRYALIIAAAVAFSAWVAPRLRADDPGPGADAPAQASADQPDNAAAPTTEPSDAGPGRRHRAFPMPDGRFEGPMAREWRRGEPLTDDQWKEIGNFMQKNSPRRWERLKDLSDEARERIGHVIARRYLQLQNIQRVDPDVYKIRLKRMKIEDDIFGLGWKLTHDSPANPQAVKNKLNQQVKALVENRLEERRVRISELQARLNQERALLKHDESNAEAEVAAHMKAIEENAKWPQLGDFAGSAPPGGAAHGPRGDRATPPGADSPSITATVKKAD